MPRYRFSWSNLDAELLLELSTALRLPGEPAEALRSAYGARPRADFIRDAWPVLLAIWLPSDARSTQRLAASLRQRGASDNGLSNDLAFLATVRNTSGLRQLALELFIEHGERTSDDRELARSLTIGAGSPQIRESDFDSPANGQSASQRPNDTSDALPDDADGADLGPVENLPEPMQLMVFLAGALAQHLDVEISLDKDGDLAIPTGSSVVYVSVTDEPLLVRIFSPMVVNVPASVELLTLLNGLNTKVPFGRFVHVNDVVFIEHHLMPSGLNAEEVVVVVNVIRSAADFFDHRIRERFGGETALLERADDEIDV